MAQGLEILPKTAKILKDKPIKIVIVGNGRYKATFLETIKKENVEEKFVIIPRQPAERIPEILACCDMGFISFADIKLWEHTIPAKLQSYMACEKAIIASASGETRQIIEEAQCGVCVKTGDEKALAEKIVEFMDMSLEDRNNLIERMGKNAREYFKSHFDKDMLMDRLEEYISMKFLQ